MAGQILQTFIRKAKHNVKRHNMKRRRLLACPVFEAENPLCTWKSEKPQEESYDDRIFVIAFLEYHLQFIKTPGRV